jgi:probable phosphoglycerate mutase
VADRVVLVRHGETEWSRLGRHTGRTDVPLTAEGRRQAARVAVAVAGRAWSLVLTSPLQRAAETCRLAGLGDRAEPDPDLEEWDYGDYEGLTTRQILEIRPGWRLWADGCPGGETAAQVAERADRVVARCRRLEGRAILFAHGHLLRVLGSRWVGADPAFGAHIVLSTAAIGVLGWEHAVPGIFGWNHTAHLAER